MEHPIVIMSLYTKSTAELPIVQLPHDAALVVKATYERRSFRIRRTLLEVKNLDLARIPNPTAACGLAGSTIRPGGKCGVSGESFH